MSQATLNINIMGRELVLACPTEEHDKFLEAARILEQNMCAVRELHGVTSVERLLLMVAFRLTVERLDKDKTTDANLSVSQFSALATRLNAMQAKIDETLATVDPVSLRHGSG